MCSFLLPMTSLQRSLIFLKVWENGRQPRQRKWGNGEWHSNRGCAIKIGKLNTDFFVISDPIKVEQKLFYLTMNHLQCSKKLAITNALEVKRKSNICYNSQLGNWREFGKTLSRAFSHQGFSTKLNFDDLGYPKWKDIPLSLNGKVLLLLRKLQNWQNCIKMSKRTKNHATDNFLIFFIFLQFLH